jgi:hypothetical protein
MLHVCVGQETELAELCYEEKKLAAKPETAI